MRRQVFLVGAIAGALAVGQAGLAVAAPTAVARGVAAQVAGARGAGARGVGSAGVGWRGLTSAEAARLAVGVNRPVIVFLKDQPALAPGRPRMMATRSAAIGASQAPLVRELRETGARRIITYRLVNSLAATVSAGEEARLKANPAVAKVIPDEVIEGPVASSTATRGRVTAASARPVSARPESGGPASARPASARPGSARPASATSARARPARITPIRGACLPHGRAQLEPEGLPLTGVASSNPKAKTAQSLGFTGAGEKVAWIADGIDPQNVNFIRKDGKSAFFVYRDFTGDGTTAFTIGGEAFGDANTIAGQGLHVYNVQNYSFQGLTVRCDVRIEGVAPGVSMEGLKTSGFINDQTTTSTFLDAVNFASVVRPVNVINESFAVNGLPDSNTTDAFKTFNDAAVALGITVVVAAGDASPSNTIGEPATDPKVISAAATTDLRAYAMSDDGAADLFAKGWLNGNISPFSSGGFDAFGDTVDVSAPGDESFSSCSKNTNLFAGCFGGQTPIGVEVFGGTSEASPWIAGVAALVDQAYRKTHHGRAPTPALVKQIILSTATNLGAPAYEQGAGLVNAYKAVLLAESIGRSHRTGDSLLATVKSISPASPSPRQGQINGLGLPGTPVTATIDVTNTGTHSQIVHVAGHTFGPANNVQNRKVVLSDAGKKFTDNFGTPNNYAETHFTVRPGQDRLTASIAYPARNAFFLTQVSFDLISPSGKLAAFSEPQGTSDFGAVDVLHPQPGRWTAVVFSNTTKRGGTTGTIVFQASTQKMASFGHVSRPSFRLPAGKTTSFTFTARTPASPGDAAGSVDINSGSVAVTLRSLVNVTAGGRFSGTVTGSNGRFGLPANGQTNYYEFRVPPGSPNVSASVDLANDPQRQVNAYLVDPAGEIAGFGSNYQLRALSAKGVLHYAMSTHMDVYAAAAIPGTWTLIVDFNIPVFGTPSLGNEVSEHYSGQVQLRSLITASTTGLPDSAATTESGPVTVPVRITNHGNSPENFFLDPRLGGSTAYPLIGENATNAPVPLTFANLPPLWNVPAETTGLSASAVSTVPITFNLSSFAGLGDPDVASFTFGSTAGSKTPSLTVTASAGSLTPGLWSGGQSPAATNGFVKPDQNQGTATFTLSATTRTFDPGASSAVGDFWLGTISPSAQFDPLFRIKPGQTAAIELTITPSRDGSPGTVVRGTLYVDVLDVLTSLNAIQVVGLTGSDVIAIPYQYKIG